MPVVNKEWVGKSCLFNNAGCMGVKVFQKLGPKGGNNRQAVEKCRQRAGVVKSVGVWDVNNLRFKSQCSHFQEECCERRYFPGLRSFPVSSWIRHVTCQFPDQGSNLGAPLPISPPPQWRLRVATTGLPGTSLLSALDNLCSYAHWGGYMS